MTQRPATPSGATAYRRRRPERTLLYRTVQTHFETWIALRRSQCDDADAVAGYVEREFRRYLECGILAHGFARAHCAQCGHDFLIAFSCKGRGVCPSCNTRRMVETAAHLTDHVLPALPVRQWVLHGGGFSVDASVRIAAADRAGRERLLRYCARPPLALERLHELGFERLGYDPPKSSPDRADAFKEGRRKGLAAATDAKRNPTVEDAEVLAHFFAMLQ